MGLAPSLLAKLPGEAPAGAGLAVSDTGGNSVIAAVRKALSAEVHAALARQQLPLLIIVDAESAHDLAAA